MVHSISPTICTINECKRNFTFCCSLVYLWRVFSLPSLQKAYTVRVSAAALIAAERWATWPHRCQGWGGARRDERWKSGREGLLCLRKLGLHWNSDFSIPDPKVTCWPLLPAWLQPSCFSWRKEARLTSCTPLDSVSRQTASCQRKHNYRASCTGFGPPNTKEVNRIGAPESPRVTVPS